jgi:hypothetical protein
MADYLPYIAAIGLALWALLQARAWADAYLAIADAARANATTSEAVVKAAEEVRHELAREVERREVAEQARGTREAQVRRLQLENGALRAQNRPVEVEREEL